MYVSGIFRDLVWANDCVNHEFLLIKLHYYGVQGVILVWFKLYLYNKKQRAELKSSKTQNFCSSWEIVKLGVPQGSFLDPLLFNTHTHTHTYIYIYIYINNFPLQINALAEVKMFADDISILVFHTKYDDFIKVFNLVLLHVSKWFQTNQSILNVEKTSTVRVNPNKFSHYPLNLVYADQVLTEFNT